MTSAGPRTRGRPPAASRELLQEAAHELFLEQGYAGTTVEHITRRAGVSRNTFFNYFASKGDLFWVELDAVIDRLDHALDTTEGDPLARVEDALVTVAGELGPRSVPFVLTQHQLIGSIDEVQASAVTRLARIATLLEAFLDTHGVADPTTVAYAVCGATVAAARSWADAGPTRGTLAQHLHPAVHPVLRGFRDS